jgi:hypothetical protein
MQELFVLGCSPHEHTAIFSARALGHAVKRVTFQRIRKSMQALVHVLLEIPAGLNAEAHDERRTCSQSFPIREWRSMPGRLQQAKLREQRAALD